MKYLIALSIVANINAMEPKKIVIPKQEQKRILLKRNGISLRRGLCFLGLDEEKIELCTLRVIDQAQREMRKSERDKQNKMMFNAIKEDQQ